MRIKNWRKYQHYKHRNPPWIKFHRRLLDDPEWFALSDAACRMLANCWLIASDNNGELPSVKDIAFRLRMAVAEVERLISELDHWVERDASKALADCEQDASRGDPQRQSTETETETEKKRYRFSGRTIRLDDSLYEAWHRNYPDLDLDAQLQSLDDWVSQQSDAAKANWIFAVSGALKNRQEAARAKKKPRFVGPQFKPEQEFVPEPPEVREARVEAWKNRGKHALVRGDDEGQEGTISELAPKEARVSDLLPALQAMDYAQED